MKSSILGCAVLFTSSLLSACGGVSNIGSSDGGSSNSGRGGFGSFGGSKGEGASGATDPTGGYSAGAVSGMGTTGKGGSTAIGGTTGKGGASSAGTGANTSMGGEAPVRLCKYDVECVGFGECEPCADGGYACDSFCVNGACISKPAGCPATCASDEECVIRDIGCITCDDGQHCAMSNCQMGVCRASKPACGTPTSCIGVSCGLPCQVCDANGCAEWNATFCDNDGACAPFGSFTCGAAKCMSTSDCGTPPPNCTPCDDGSCAKFGCFSNQCKLTCGSTSSYCKYAEECSSLGTECKMCPSGQCAVPACIQNGCSLVCPL